MTHKLTRFLLAGAFAGSLVAPALASPAPDTTGTAAAKTAQAPAPTTTPSPAPGPTDPTQPTPNPSEPGRPRPTATTTTTPTTSPGAPSERPSETRPADPGTTAPASPSGILRERTVPEAATASLTPAQAKQAEKILKELHKSNELEIALGSLAREKASSDAVKEYAKELVDAHQTADKKLLDYAATRGLALVVSPSPDAVPGAGAPIAPSKFGDAKPTTGSDLGAPAGAATGAVGTHGASAGNPGAASAGNPSVTTPTNPGAATATNPSPTGREPSTGVLPTPATDMVSPPPQLDAEGRKTVARLEKLEGAAFDKAFLTTMVRNHGKTLGKIKSFESKKLESELSALLGDSRTMVENHLRRAKELQREASTSLPPASRTLGALQ